MRSPIGDKTGLTLFELLVSLAVVALIMGGLYRILTASFAGYEDTKHKQRLLDTTGLVMGRMVLFVQETDSILRPAQGETDSTVLKVSERVLDTYDNTTRSYVVDGDGIPDADNDCDGVINDYDAAELDPKEYVEFKLEGGVLYTRGPDYGTADPYDVTPYRTLCENVTVFRCDRLAENLVEIRLTLTRGDKEVTLRSRVHSRNMLAGQSPMDHTPPAPNPMTWAAPPDATGASSLSMTASTATDWSGTEYYFACTAGGGHDSGWQESSTYEDTGLNAGASYTYRVKARDGSANRNETAWSSEQSCATQAGTPMYVYDITMSWRATGLYYGRATVWIKDQTGADVVGATVYGSFSGCADEAHEGLTGQDGKTLIESTTKNKSCTWTFTVTDVVKPGWAYTPALNNKTADSIPVP